MGDVDGAAEVIGDGEVRVDAEELINRRDDVAGGDRMADRIRGLLVRFAEDATSFDAAAGEQAEAADRKSTRLNSSHVSESRMPSSA